MAMMGEPRINHATGGVLKTKQADKDAVDINKIVARARANNTPIPVGPRVGHYGDFSDGPSLQDALHRVMEAQEQFDQLPARVRAFCGNDPARFLELVHQDEGLEDLIKVGLKAELVPKPVDPAAVAPVATAGSPPVAEGGAAPTA